MEGLIGEGMASANCTFNAHAMHVLVAVSIKQVVKFLNISHFRNFPPGSAVIKFRLKAHHSYQMPKIRTPLTATVGGDSMYVRHYSVQADCGAVESCTEVTLKRNPYEPELVQYQQLSAGLRVSARVLQQISTANEQCQEFVSGNGSAFLIAALLDSAPYTVTHGARN